MARHDGHERGKKGDKGKRSVLDDILAQRPDTQIVFVGSLNCLRHKETSGIGRHMQAHRAAILCPTMTDFSTGRYLHQLEDAIVELAAERDSRSFVVVYGCQWVILSTDAELMAATLRTEHGIEVSFRDASNLEKGEKGGKGRHAKVGGDVA